MNPVIDAIDVTDAADAMAVRMPRLRRRADRRSSSRANGTAADIARRAYELYIERGGEHGRDLDDWLRAELELTSRSVES